MLCLVTWLTQSSTSLQGQSVLEIPYDMNWAGMPIHLTHEGRLKVQLEVQRLYVDPTTIHNDINALRQLTPLVKPLLNKANLPDDFRFIILPFVDVDSLGFWTLSQTQARSLELRIDQYVDERFHLTVSTEAVLYHLVRLQETQRNYALTLLNYLQESTSLSSLQSIDPTYILLDSQSPPLIWKILARKLVFEQEELAYGPSVNLIVYTYQNAGGQALHTIAERLQIDENRIKPFNKWLKSTYIPTNKEYTVFVQVTPDEFSTVQTLATPGLRTGSLHQVADAFPMLIKVKGESDKLRSAAIFYRINERRGVQAQNCDSFITLAFYGHITVKNFLKFNDLNVNYDVVRSGEVYYLEHKARRAKIPFHVAQKNQTVQQIASIYGVRLTSLLKYNHMTIPQRLQMGRIVWLQTKRPKQQPIEYIQLPVEEPVIAENKSIDTGQNQPDANKTTLFADSLLISVDSLYSDDDTLIPQNSASVSIPEKIKRHVVMPGQTYYAISRLYGVTVNQLYAWNKLSERIPLRIGQQLIVGVSEKQRFVLNKPIHKRKVQPAPPKRNVIFYTVQAGQTLYRIAVQHNVRLQDLMRWNNLTNYVIEVGQIVLIWK